MYGGWQETLYRWPGHAVVTQHPVAFGAHLDVYTPDGPVRYSYGTLTYRTVLPGCDARYLRVYCYANATVSTDAIVAMLTAWDSDQR